MESVKTSLYRMDPDLGVASLFCAFAYFAGSKRFIGVFSGTNRQGLLFAAATSSAGLGAARSLEDRVKTQVRMKKDSPQHLLFKSAVVATTALLTTAWVAKTLGKGAKISSKASHQFACATSGVIVGARFVDPLKKLCFPKVFIVENLRRDLAYIEKHRVSDWELEESVLNFNIDDFLKPIGNENIIDSDRLKTVFPATPEFDACIALIDANYKGNDLVGKHRKAIKWYLNKIFCFLLEKKDAATTADGQEKYHELARTISSHIIDAETSCLDQVLSQLECLVIRIVDDKGCSDTQKLVVLEVNRYRKLLIQEVVRATGEEHAADLEIELAKALYVEMNLPLPKSLQEGAVFRADYEQSNFKNAQAAFKKMYDPIKYLAENVNYHSARKVFAEMGQWYSDNFFPEGLDKATEQERTCLLGTDFNDPGTMAEQKNSAVLYWLYMHDIIQEKGS